MRNAGSWSRRMFGGTTIASRWCTAFAIVRQEPPSRRSHTRTMSDLRGRSIPSVSTAWWGVRTYRGTTALLALVAGVGLAAAMPAVSFGGWWSPRLHETPSIDALAAQAGRFGHSPTWLRAEALRLLVAAFGGVALAAFVVAALGALLLFATRAGERAGEMAVRRAVGAARRTLLTAALLEGAVVSLGALAAGLPLGLLWTRAAEAGWSGRVD